ncbi:hypothetical protein [Ferruginibacter sp.]|nr:hypothetical protein [Ferruginibacter sp.]
MKNKNIILLLVTLFVSAQSIAQSNYSHTNSIQSAYLPLLISNTARLIKA